MSNAATKWLPAELDMGPLELVGDEQGFVFGEPPEVELALSDLMQDAGGEIVLYNDSGLRALGLVADAPVVSEGDASAHVTASGDDVTGFKYVSFANGLTLYYQDGLDLIVRSA
ncbi:MAG TPA: hypothetical protein VHL31_24120 [Geminicoccus sp.]|jgi:hypothetical protein|uniref:hypothetical protein n=1 Tax=Geminicoccus sp. TaxID=2024832 RepID=UPI002E301E35|nr:hypothetical protein [Geminicoccus sp.]HEX2529366.1 hypothetical protein [Geminicoccus sp.]